jgi:glycosyltransferase involved in cell wall biosynthesis
MRIVHVISSLDPRCGGPTTALVALVRAQVQEGHSVTVVATWSRKQPPGSADELKEAGADVRLIGPCFTPLVWHWKISPVLREAIDGASIVHIHAIWEEIQHRAACIARELNVPYVVTAHGMLDPWSLSQRSTKKQLYLFLRLRHDLDSATAMHYTTDIERDLVGPMRLRTDCIVEPYCLDLSDYRSLPQSGYLRKRYPQIGKRKIVLFYSRLHEKKGLDLLIPAFAKAADEDSVLVLAGPCAPEYEAVIDKMIAEHGLQDRVIKTGMLYNGSRVAALRDADLFVLPSYQENFGIAVVEALAAGTPVIISDQVNIYPTIAKEQVGAVIPTNVDALAEQLSHWLRDANAREVASQRARRFVFDEYDASRSVRRWTSHYARIIASHRSRRAASTANAVPEGFVAPEGFMPSGAGARPGLTSLARHHSS